MALPPDDQLLNFDTGRLADFDPDRAQDALHSEDGDLYRNHLVIAHWLQAWVERLEESQVGSDREADYHWNQALREVAAHLRQGDLMPGGVLYDEAVQSLLRPVLDRSPGRHIRGDERAG